MAKRYTVVAPNMVGQFDRYGVTFVNGVAKGIKPGFALDEFKTLGYEIVEEGAVPDVDVTEEMRQAALDSIAQAEKAADAEAEDSVPDEATAPVIVVDELTVPEIPDAADFAEGFGPLPADAPE